MAYDDSDFLNSVADKVKTYLASYLEDKGYDVTLVLGWIDFTNKLPLGKVHVSFSTDDTVDFTSPGYANAVGDNDTATVATLTMYIDTWASRGSDTNPSRSGGKTGASRIAACIAKAFTQEQHLFFQQYPEVEEIDSFRIRFSRNPESFDGDDLFQVNSVLVIKVLLQ